MKIYIQIKFINNKNNFIIKNNNLNFKFKNLLLNNNNQKNKINTF